jgi:hypothetical protein
MAVEPQKSVKLLPGEAEKLADNKDTELLLILKSHINF